MADKRTDTGVDSPSEITLYALLVCLGAFGVVAFVFGYPVLGWIGMAGFIMMLIWMILTTPKKPGTRSDGGSSGVWIMGDGDGGGGAAGGDGGGAG
ncbi:MAG: hypothetical protein AB8B82_13515 [Roseovarius sp.]